MFIRYNQVAQYYEYDTSAAQNGAGPWNILPLNGNVAGGLPANVAYTDRMNTFTTTQLLSSGFPVFELYNTGAPVDQRRIRFELSSDLYISHVNDADNAYQYRFVFGRGGDVSFPAGFYSAGIITAGSAVRANAGIESRGNNAQIIMLDAGGTAGIRIWRMLQYNDGTLHFELCNDSFSPLIRPLSLGGNNIVTFGGNYTVFNAGIYLPNVSSNPGLLDHYEEGTWTPTLKCPAEGTSGTSYNIQTGRYVRIGQFVHCDFDVQMASSNWGSTGNAVYVSDFPFIALSDGTSPAGPLNYFYFTAGAVVNLNLSMNGNSTQAALNYKNASTNQVDGALTTSSIGPGSRFIGSLSYRTNT